ncbi:MAG TPA: hypothetical protein VGJ84_08255, partial [Polyangiaceae bacterium]
MTIRKSRILTLALAAAGIALFQSGPSAAQADLNPPMPNVMLLVDSSGSMERKASDDQFPMCDPTGAQASERSRWIDAMEVLTGSIQNYRCESVDRGSNAFKQEYTLSGPPPYDFQYALPYHRPLSGTCTPGPGVK